MSFPVLLTSDSPVHTQAIGMALGQLLRGGDVICLSGDLGAGKTWLTGGIAKGWGAVEPVHSPTFVFIHVHHQQTSSQLLQHIDCYRLTGDDDAFSIGLEELLNSTDVIILEWPERVLGLLPPDRLWIDIDPDENNPETHRQLLFTATGERYEIILNNLQAVLQNH